MAATVVKFEYKVMAQDRDECIEALDEIVRDILTKEGGEPWVSIQEEYIKTPLNQELAFSGDPRGFVWVGVRTVLFTGPTKFDGVEPQFRDGFRPQTTDEESGPEGPGSIGY